MAVTEAEAPAAWGRESYRISPDVQERGRASLLGMVQALRQVPLCQGMQGPHVSGWSMWLSGSSGSRVHPSRLTFSSSRCCGCPAGAPWLLLTPTPHSLLPSESCRSELCDLLCFTRMRGTHKIEKATSSLTRNDV